MRKTVTFLGVQGWAFMHADRLLPLTVPLVCSQIDLDTGLFWVLERCGPPKHVSQRRLTGDETVPFISRQHNRGSNFFFGTIAQ
jgi:hypothetical protein